MARLLPLPNETLKCRDFLDIHNWVENPPVLYYLLRMLRECRSIPSAGAGNVIGVLADRIGRLGTNNGTIGRKFAICST